MPLPFVSISHTFTNKHLDLFNKPFVNYLVVAYCLPVKKYWLRNECINVCSKSKRFLHLVPLQNVGSGHAYYFSAIKDGADSVFSLVFSTTGKRGFQTGRVAVADVYYICFKAILGGNKWYYCRR